MKQSRIRIKKGEMYRCLKDFVMDDGSISYYKGRLYKSEKDDCLTDEQGFVEHWITDIDHSDDEYPFVFNEYFILVANED
jgi:hypothetical protein